jgi:Family of unknown function (DUF6311)
MSSAGAASFPIAIAVRRVPALPWLLSLLAGVAGALALLPVQVLLGTSPFWDNPRGVVGGSWADMLAASSGYSVFVRDAWRWPLFQAAGLGPNGANILFTDSVPVVALLGRLLFQATGRVVPLYGLWSGLCIVGMGLAFTGLVRALGTRSLAAAVAASVIGVSMPALIGRWGHLSLMAQALLPLALAIYVRLRAAPQLRAGTVFAWSSGMCVGSLLVHPYLLLMVGGIMTAAILQAGTDRRMPRPAAAAVLAGLAAATGGAMLAMGYGTSSGAESDMGFGVYSANLLSPFLPYDGVLPGGGAYTMDGTGGQYEGAAFVGFGVLVLIIVGWRSLAEYLARGARRHPWLLSVTTGFLLLAISNEVYLGSVHLLSIPLPKGVLWAAGIFRSSGRFAWVAMYLVTALAIVAAAQRKQSGLVLLLAAAIQCVTVMPLRQMIRESAAGMPEPVLDRAAWLSVLPGADQLVVDPPFGCLPKGPSSLPLIEAAVELQLMASQTGVPTNTLYASRTAPDCTVPLLNSRSLVAYLRPVAARPELTCRAGPLMTVCSASPQALPASLATIALEAKRASP